MSNIYEKPDFYTKKAKDAGYFARSIYKLEEIENKMHLFKKGMKVVDLGCAPGSWSQYVSNAVGESGLVIGIDYKKIASTMPYMYTDDPERIEFSTEPWMVDQIIDWFGKDIKIENTENENEVLVSLSASPYAMEHWAMQYLNHVKVIAPEHLRERIKENLEKAIIKY